MISLLLLSIFYLKTLLFCMGIFRRKQNGNNFYLKMKFTLAFRTIIHLQILCINNQMIAFHKTIVLILELFNSIPQAKAKINHEN